MESVNRLTTGPPTQTSADPASLAGWPLDTTSILTLSLLATLIAYASAVASSYASRLRVNQPESDSMAGQTTVHLPEALGNTARVAYMEYLRRLIAYASTRRTAIMLDNTPDSVEDTKPNSPLLYELASKH
jgi:hypothetical protein